MSSTNLSLNDEFQKIARTVDSIMSSNNERDVFPLLRQYYMDIDNWIHEVANKKCELCSEVKICERCEKRLNIACSKMINSCIVFDYISRKYKTALKQLEVKAEIIS